MPKTLLLADDSVTIQKVVGISFANEDVQLLTVDNGDDAIARAKDSRPDLILADVVMPGKNGYEVCEAIKADPDLCHIPVLLLTGTFEAFDEERAQRAGAAGHVSKPFEAQTLVEQAKRLLAASPAPAPRAAPAAPPATAPAPAAATTPRPAPPQATSPPTPPAPAAPPRPAPAAPPTPAGPGVPIGTLSAPPPAPPLEDSFDFFDDEVQELSSPATPVPVGTTDMPDELELDSPESAFAFGDEELTPIEETAPEPRAATPLASPPPGDRTIAILPDDDAAEPPPGLDGGQGFGDDDLAPFGSAFETSAQDSASDSDSLGPITPAGDFDFDFETETPAPIATAIEEPLVPVDPADLAQATILDPNGASGFDVSSSDLGDPLASGPTGPQASSPGSTGDRAATSAPTLPPDPPSRPEPAQPPMSVERNAATTRPPDAASVSSGSLFEETVPSGPRPPRAPSDGPPPIPDLDPAPEAFAPMIEAEPLAMGTDLETELGAEPASEPATWSAASAEAIGAEALEAIRPRLRAQLHDTLEKIAWESFSDLTETIVRQAVERVEQVAWEVIPQLAETLVREEIRRMKGEDS